MASWENEGRESIFAIWEELLREDNYKYIPKEKQRKEKKIQRFNK